MTAYSCSNQPIYPLLELNYIVNTATKMISFLLILLSIVHCAGIADEEKPMSFKRNAGQDILSTIMSNVASSQLIQIIYDPSIPETHIASIEQELRERIIREDNRDLLLHIYLQRKNGKRMPHFVHAIEDQISENARLAMQSCIDRKCNKHLCDLSAEGFNSGIISNEWLEALAYFDKEIVVPSHVKCLVLSRLRLTSLWLRIEQDSLIDQLILPSNDFKELNNETFGQYIHEKCRWRIRVLSLYGCKSITKIDFDELALPNLIFLGVIHCTALFDIKNIPWSMQTIRVLGTGIRHNEQLQFKNDSGNDLMSIYCDKDCEDEFNQVFDRLNIVPICICDEL